jgi:carbon monoxide dehydrogenase subunit G
MAFTADVEIKRRFEVNCPFERVFDLLANVPESASHFPNVDQLVDLGDNTFRWEMKKIGVDRFHVQTIYACKYVDDREKGIVKWTPVKGEGNGTVKGKWTIKNSGGESTRVDLSTSGELEVPLPSLVKFIVAPLVAHEFEKMVDAYIENLCKTFSKPLKKKAASKKKSS